MKELTKKQKDNVDKDVVELIYFNLRSLKLPITKANVYLARAMFVEGVRYTLEIVKREDNEKSD